MKQSDEINITTNRRATHDFFIIEKFEAGIELRGTEVKSLREGHASLKESYAAIRNGELFLLKSHIPPYKYGSIDNHQPDRDRKLLLKRLEIRRLKRGIEGKGFTIVPLRIYFNRSGRAKVELALAKGKREYDKRKEIADREAKRQIDRMKRGGY